MRNAETILGILQERGQRGLPVEDLYRQLYNRDLYLRAYARLYTNQGALTPGTTSETADGMTLAKIDQIIDDLRHERYRWTPVRRTYIPKRNGKTRPLGILSWSDKLLQEVLRSLLEAYFEPQFNRHSHGFRPGRGCHTALDEITKQWTGTRWFIEGDISQCFDRINHSILLSILREKIHDNRFLRLVQGLVQAGYLEDWNYHATLSGTPQGGVISPLLANLYLDRLDQFVEEKLLPVYTRGERRQDNHRYTALSSRIRRRQRRGRSEEVKALTQELQRLPSGDPQDPNYRRLRYVRYADDFLLGFIGPKAEAVEIKRLLREFLQQHLDLELSEEKTVITHARSQAAHFLGYEIVTQYADDQHDTHGHRNLNGRIGLRVSADVVKAKCAPYLDRGKPMHRTALMDDDDFSIIAKYQGEYRGIVQYYLMAHNVSWFWTLHWIMRGSLLKTLAYKHKTSVMKILRKYETTIPTEYGVLKCLEFVVERGPGQKPLTARFGGIPLRRQKTAILVDHVPVIYTHSANELIKRLLADQCELCGRTEHCEVHHVRRLADLKVTGRKEKPEWVKRMAARRRKTLVVCAQCHDAIHAGRPTSQPILK